MKYRLIYLLLLILVIFPLQIRGENKITIRVGHFPTITHAQGVIGHGLSRQNQGWFEKSFGPDIDIQWFIYSDGPSAMEAVFADSIDLVYVGPSPTINAYIRSKGKILRIIAGACSGGAALVVQPEIKTIPDFKGKKIATPQFGNTQDVAARSWFKKQGFHVILTGGDLNIIPMSGSSQLTLFKQKVMDGAWNVEPWVSRLVLEAGGVVFLNESEIWPETGGEYVTTHLISSQKFLDEHSELVRTWVQSHVNLTKWINQHPNEAKALVNRELKEEIKKDLSQEVLDRAWKQLKITNNPIPLSLFITAEEAYRIGFIKQKPDLEGIYDLRFLKEALKQSKD